jgi:hypothetical protein
MFSLRRVLVLLALLLALGASAAPAGAHDEGDTLNHGASHRMSILGPVGTEPQYLEIEMKPILITSYQTGGESDATLETVVEIVPPTDETGIIIVSVYSEGGPGVTDLSFTKYTDRSSPVLSGPTLNRPVIICIPEAGTLCPP